MATTKLYLDTRKASDMMPMLKVVISHNRKSAYLPLGIKVPLSKWDPVRQSVMGSTFRGLQRVIMQKKNEIDDALYSILEKGISKSTTAIQLRDKILKIVEPDQCSTDDKNSFMSVFRRFISTRPTSGTQSVYTQTYKKICLFDDHADDLSFDDIDLSWLKSFDAFLSQTIKSQNSKSIHFRNIRAVFNAAIDDEITTKYPFRKFKIKSEETRKRSLSLEQLQLLMNASLEPWMERYRDIFMILFLLCGINIIDLCHLKSIENGRIEYRRAKTHKLYSIKVEPEAEEIIKKYQGKSWLLNILDNYGNSQDFNRRLKRGLDAIVEHINATVSEGEHLPHISSYWARHTWATLASDIDVPIETISAALGHSYGCATTAIYIRFNQKKVDIANRKVLDYVYNVNA